MLPKRERNVSALTIPMSQEQYDRVCERMENFRLDLMDMIDDEPRAKDCRVYVLGMQLVPVTTEGTR